MISITKDALRQLNAATGKLDVDSGKIVAGFIGRLHMSDRLYHGEIQYSLPGDDPPRETVSVLAITSSEMTEPSEPEDMPDGDA